MTQSNSWWVFNGQKDAPRTYDQIKEEIPPFRALASTRGKNFVLNAKYKGDAYAIDLINAALYLKRPLLVRGLTGIGKSSLADAIAFNLGLPLLFWPITSHSNLKEGLYDYDIVGHVADKMQTGPIKKNTRSNAVVGPKPIQDFLNLRELGTALAVTGKSPVVLLIDEVDKGDMDFPNSLLHVLEEGYFVIPELVREGDKTVNIKTVFTRYEEKDLDNLPQGLRAQIRQNQQAKIKNGKLLCKPELFPIVIMTSNGEREFPAPFLRRCIQLDFNPPDQNKLYEILERHFRELAVEHAKSLRGNAVVDDLILKFIDFREPKELSTDALLNAVYMYLCAPNVEKRTLENIVTGNWDTTDDL